MFRSVLFNEAETGAQRVATVGHLFDGAKVLAIGGDDPVTIVRDSGLVTSIPAGSVVQTVPANVPAVLRRAPVVRKVASKPKGAPGSVVGVSYHEQFALRTVYVGDSITFEFMVVAIVQGDPSKINLANGRSVDVQAGAVARWHYGEGD